MPWDFLEHVAATVTGVILFFAGWAFVDWWTDKRVTDSTEDADSEKAPQHEMGHCIRSLWSDDDRSAG
jgi:hypothetical protein